MAFDPAALIGDWVEVREEGGQGQIVLRPANSPIPPARGRRGLTIEQAGVVHARAPGADDRTTSTPGAWSIVGDRLTIDAPGWSGKYHVAQSSPEKLVLTAE
jgi:hypothetical protein